MEINKRFPVLSTVSLILKIFGWVVVTVGMCYFLYEGIIEPNQKHHSFGSDDTMQLIIGFVIAGFGLMNVALGEIIKVFFAIEENTQTSSSMLEAMKFRVFELDKNTKQISDDLVKFSEASK